MVRFLIVLRHRFWTCEAPELNHAYDARDAVSNLTVQYELALVWRNHLVRPIVHVQLAQLVQGLEPLRLLLVLDRVRQYPDVVEVRLACLSLHILQHVVAAVLCSVRLECEDITAPLFSKTCTQR